MAHCFVLGSLPRAQELKVTAGWVDCIDLGRAAELGTGFTAVVVTNDLIDQPIERFVVLYTAALLL
jgi:hypothetical protein